jgi:hypothetical protein
MAGTYDIQPVGPEDIKAWPKMTFGLLKRNWWLWVIFLAVNCGLSLSMLAWPGSVFAGKILWMIYEATIPVFMFELAMLMAMKSDLQFSWSALWNQLRINYSSSNIYKVHGIWIIFSCFIWNILFFGNTHDIERYDVATAAGDTYKMTTLVLENASYQIISVMFLCALTAAGTVVHHLRVICQQDYAVAVSMGTKVLLRVVFKNFRQMSVVPLMMVITAMAFGGWGIGLFLLPYMITWRYVAARELLQGGGNKAVQKVAATYGFAVPQGAGA